MPERKLIIMLEDKVVIVLATYQGEEYIREQIDSIINQTYDNWELYIHDDGSKDLTSDILLEYQNNMPEKIHVMEGPSQGGARNNFMYMFDNVDAPYVMCCDQDDVWVKDKVEVTLKAIKGIETDEDIPLMAFSDVTVVDSELNVIADSMGKYQTLNYNNIDFNSLMIQNVVTGCTMMINRKLLVMSRTDDTSRIIMHDWWCAMIAARFGRLVYIPRQLVLYRQHGDNCVGAKKVSSVSYAVDKLKKKNSIKNSLIDTRKQAGYFSEVFQLEKSDVASKYSALGEKGKLSRINFYRKNKIWESGIMRNIGLILMG